MSDPEEARIRARVRDDIARYGWHVVLIPPDAGTPGWGHTIGMLERFDHPELIVFGRELEIVRGLVNRLGAHVAHGQPLTGADRVRGILADALVAIRPVDPRWTEAFLGNAAWHYERPSIPALQCFWPDANGMFPWDPAADPAWRNDQPLLFEPSGARALPGRWAEVLRSEGLAVD